MNLTAVAIGSLVTSLACVGLSIPAILRKIPMNKMYGVRFRQCFKSDEAWYEINAYGGKALLVAAIPNFLLGLYGLIRPNLPGYFSWICLVTIYLSFGVAIAASYRRALKVDAALSAKEK